MNQPKHPRLPTAAERQALIAYICRQMYTDTYPTEVQAGVRRWLTTAYISVFDAYTTTCSGYSGKIMLMMWETGPELYEAFIWQADQWE